MISIITPTMWKNNYFCDFLFYLTKLDVVGEVILINNDVKNTPIHKALLNEKVKILNQSENIYCNPAWNLGVLNSTYDNLCLLSDDVICDLKLFLIAEDFLNEKEDVGLLGIHPGQNCPGIMEDCHPDFKHLRVLLSDGTVKIFPYNNEDHVSRGYGSLFFMKRELWTIIPNDIKIWGGDSIQWRMMTKRNKQNYLMGNAFFYTEGNGTVKTLPPDELQAVSEKDSLNCTSYFVSEGI